MNSCVDLPPSPPLSPYAPGCDLETMTHDALFEAVAPTLSPAHLSSGETADLELADEEPPRKVRIIIRPRVLSDNNGSIGGELPSQTKAYASESDYSNLNCFPLSTPFELFPPESSAAEHPIENSTKEGDTFSVDRILGRWGRNLFFLRWDDGTHSWEPRGNILDEQMLESFEENYVGFLEGVDVLGTRMRNRKFEYKIHWAGRPDSENSWLAEKDMSPELLSRNKPSVKQKRRKRQGK
ncbi:DUF3435 domain protein [Colletotrichum kahawae]|uniref:DUF3435 domain protein n=1 Tax=Colletotrichum kahawae TaxID=34407 RepID=A0AAD9YT68_COLKA|nr:DUF3435 domain protein [Colletotrichum kahawae]